MSYPFKFNIGDLVFKEKTFGSIWPYGLAVIIEAIRDPHAREDYFKIKYSNNVVAVISESSLKLVQKTK